MFVGRTRGNRVVIVKANQRLVGQLVPVRFSRVTANTLYGDLVLEGVENEMEAVTILVAWVSPP